MMTQKYEVIEAPTLKELYLEVNKRLKYSTGADVVGAITVVYKSVSYSSGVEQQIDKYLQVMTFTKYGE